VSIPTDMPANRPPASDPPAAAPGAGGRAPQDVPPLRRGEGWALDSLLGLCILGALGLDLFGGVVKFARRKDAWSRATGKRPYTTNSRGVGLIDMAQSIEAGRPHRCSAAMALHVLEVMERTLDAARTGKPQRITTTCERPAPLEGKLT